MPSSISKSRLAKAFNEGRRSATVEAAENPYENPKLRQLWERGRAGQRSGELKTPIPPLEPGETRAERVVHNPPGSKPKPIPRPRHGPRNGPRGSGPRNGPRDGPRPGGFRGQRGR